MERRKTPVSGLEQAVGYAVLVVLCAISIYVLIRQSQFNPAVLMTLDDGALPGQLQVRTATSRSAIAALIPEDLRALTALSMIETFGSENLSDKIDGKAELYLSAGFKEMACRSFVIEGGSGTRIELYIYQMDSSHGAYAVYTGQRRTGSEPSHLTAKAYFTENGLFFASGSYYVEMVADRASQGLRQSLEEIGSKVLAGLPAETEKIEEAALFPRRGLIEDSIRFTASDAFGLEGFVDVFTAEYRLESGEASAFFSTRATEEEAKNWAQIYLQFLRNNGYLEIETDAAPPGATVLNLDNVFEVVMVRERVLAGGAHDATSLQVALELARDMALELHGSQK